MPYGRSTCRIASVCIGSESTRTPSMSKMTAANLTRPAERRSGPRGHAGSPDPPEHLIRLHRALCAKQRLPHQRGAGEPVSVPREVLLQLDERRARQTVRLDERSVATDDPRLLVTGDLLAAEDPRRAEGAAADHDGGTPGGGDHRAGVRETPHVAVAGDGRSEEHTSE